MHLKSTYGSTMNQQQQPQLAEDNHRSSVGTMSSESSPKGFSKFYSLAFGQVLSVLVAGTGACTTIFQKYSHMNAPTSQNAPNYVLLSLFLISPFRRGGIVPKSKQPLQTNHHHHESEESTNIILDQNLLRKKASKPDQSGDHWWRYIILAIVDVEANVTVVWAYQYTSITSAMLLDCFTIPSVMVLSYFFLNAKYTPKHILGAFLCLCGICLIILSDVLNQSSNEDDEDGDDDHSNNHPHAWAGDLLCIISAFLYSVSNVIQEKWVKTSGPSHFLGRLGICGAILSITQAAIFERKALLNHTNWNMEGIGAWIGYTSSLTTCYILTSWFLVYADAAFFNLSLLTSDVYAVLFSYFFNGTVVPFLYFVAFGFTISGLFIYHRTPPATISSYSPLFVDTVSSTTNNLHDNDDDGGEDGDEDLGNDKVEQRLQRRKGEVEGNDYDVIGTTGVLVEGSASPLTVSKDQLM